MSDKSYANATKITPGTPVSAADGVLISCSVAGTQKIKLKGGDPIALQVNLGPNLLDGFAVSDAPVGGTATADVYALYRG